MKKGILAIVIMSLSASVLAAGDIAAGEQKSLQCAACHGAKGVSANPEWPNLAGQGEKYLIKQLRDFKSGARKNPIMMGQASTLTVQDIENLAAYFASQEPAVAKTKGAGDNPDEMLDMAQQLYRGGDMNNGIPACLACHGPSGRGIEPSAFPRLSAQHAPYTRIQLNAFKEAAGENNLATDTNKAALVMRANDQNAMMRDIAKKLTPKQIEAISYYVQGLH